MIAAAGSGERLGAGGPKAYVVLGGRPMLAWSLVAAAAADSIRQIVIAAPPGTEGRAEEVAAQAGVEARAVPGGEHRSDSVALALEHAEHDYVVVHDAARPLASAALMDRVVQRLAADPDIASVIAAAPVSDTIKEASGARKVLRTPERSRLWAVQTPQAFRTESLRDAIAAHDGDLSGVTDDAMLIEREGGDVLIHEASTENLKVTTPLDLRVAQMLLAERD
ncbi:MAG TPA: 2-C-methyl-D-erythritol 4-phosphate cytidylyltransferase [Solirubrobacterales bacterium]|nr:2-C-methyl-D-erythritol 4-phosphate cytidylyltransferase [Solirubrobacterales bacterium]